MPGTRSCVVSASLSTKLGLVPGIADDDEDKEQEMHETDGVVGRVAASEWRRWMRYALASTFLARIEYNGADGFADAVFRTEVEADAIERRLEAEQAERETKQAQERQLPYLRRAAAVLRNSGAGTMDQARRACASIELLDPGGPPVSEIAIIRELARLAA